MLIAFRRFLSPSFSLVRPANVASPFLSRLTFYCRLFPSCSICGVSFSRISIRSFFFRSRNDGSLLFVFFFLFVSLFLLPPFLIYWDIKSISFYTGCLTGSLSRGYEGTAEAHIYVSVNTVLGSLLLDARQKSTIGRNTISESGFMRNWFLAQRVLLSMSACAIYDSKSRLAIIDEKIQAKIQASWENICSEIFSRPFSPAYLIYIYIRLLISTLI